MRKLLFFGPKKAPSPKAERSRWLFNCQDKKA
ncbi:hypothetical protein SGRA_1619 [Saprospira grandis str. Lewin]|uniref:Uncharacterized protein n=1 Tax=Saprospira grandis (strain Lewin) TaxID=984262 RepID=H6L9Z1_SAPGL|nr:hypothetical protein SGRA_1619 [Saprospira grandis str. Lewin]